MSHSLDNFFVVCIVVGIKEVWASNVTNICHIKQELAYFNAAVGD